MGVLTETGPNGVREKSTYTCQHCGGMQHVAAFVRPEDHGGVCKSCFHFICPNCVGKPCIPIEKWLEAQEDPRAWRRLYGI